MLEKNYYTLKLYSVFLVFLNDHLKNKSNIHLKMFIGLNVKCIYRQV